MSITSEPYIELPRQHESAKPVRDCVLVNVTIDLDHDVVERFKRRGPDWKEQIEAVLSGMAGRLNS